MQCKSVCEIIKFHFTSCLFVSLSTLNHAGLLDHKSVGLEVELPNLEIMAEMDYLTSPCQSVW